MNIAVVYGGESTEREVSIVSSIQLINNIGVENVIIPIYIDSVGDMYECGDYKDIKSYEDSKYKHKVTFVPNSKYLYRLNKFGRFVKNKKIDFAYVVMHGKNGEDGTMASVLNMSHIPYSCSDILGSAVCLDKAVFKNAMFGLGVNIVPYITLLEKEYDRDKNLILDKIDRVLDYPVIVKPSNLGSSIGIKVFDTRESLEEGIYECFSYDSMLVIEKYVDIDYEVNVALLEYNNEYVFSAFEIPGREDDILSFKDKYIKKIDGRKIILSIGDDMDESIKDMSRLVYDTLRLSGIVRFDYIVDKAGILYLNELNTIPGSMANYLYKDRGIEYTDLLNMIAREGSIRYSKKKDVTNNFSSEILSKVKGNKFGM